MNIVILDARTTNPGDIDWHPIQRLGNCTIFPNSTVDQIIERSSNAEIVLINKVKMTHKVIDHLPKLKCICLLATGYDNVDLQTCKENSIAVFNAVGYSSPSVAQQVFAGILHMIHRIDLHDQSVKRGEWSNQPDFSYHLSNLTELQNKTLGIYGLGRIGRQVGEIGRAFGMNIIAHHKHPKRDHQEWITFVDKETLFSNSDYLTLHAPLNQDNRNFVNESTIKLMKPSAMIINTGRGALIHERDMFKALKNRLIRSAYIDVLDQEPPSSEHPFFELENCFMSPHLSWASVESRQRLVNIVAENISRFLSGNLSDSLTS